MSDAMYRDQILDHYKHPHNQGHLDKPDARFSDNNPLCGDEIEVFLKIGKDAKGKAIIADVKFKGQGCAISTASASMLTDEIKGLTLDQIKALTRDDVFKMLGVPISPARVKCALLSLKAIKAAVYAYLGQKLNEKVE
ncbi:SUF system NifU family Fe-S cluster assembly protein [Candidatus Micrarchaeota archaeon]|nr:SUF system NifU family Fe-S cluster assembly protein [Candidatus Micrarchaeota archaeon]